jgi:hypothetical protein
LAERQVIAIEEKSRQCTYNRELDEHRVELASGA